MLARTLSLAAVVALATLAPAAPAPFAKSTAPEQPEINFSGMNRDLGLNDGAPTVIASQAAYQSVVRAWGVANPPKVDFRTHFLHVTSSRHYLGETAYHLHGGDLRATNNPKLFKCEMPADAFHYKVKSFRRADVKSVNGVALPPAR